MTEGVDKLALQHPPGVRDDMTAIRLRLSKVEEAYAQNTLQAVEPRLGRVDGQLDAVETRLGGVESTLVEVLAAVRR